MFSINVIAIQSNSVFSNYLFTGDLESEVVKQAEQKFRECVKRFSPYLEDEIIDEWLGEQYWDSDSGQIVAISYPHHRDLNNS
jgi:hypothetical protein